MNTTDQRIINLDKLQQLATDTWFIYGIRIEVQACDCAHELYMIYHKGKDGRMHSLLYPLSFHQAVCFFLQLAQTITKYKNLGAIGGTNAAPMGDIWASGDYSVEGR